MNKYYNRIEANDPGSYPHHVSLKNSDKNVKKKYSFNHNFSLLSCLSNIFFI